MKSNPISVTVHSPDRSGHLHHPLLSGVCTAVNIEQLAELSAYNACQEIKIALYSETHILRRHKKGAVQENMAEYNAGFRRVYTECHKVWLS